MARHGEMKVAVQVRQGRFDGRDWRVIAPAEGTGNAGLWINQHWRDFYLDRRAAYRIGVLWLLAARSRHTIVHLPLRGGRQPVNSWHEGARCDLVLSHHSLQLRASLWPRLRAVLGRGRQQTATVPASDLPDPAGIDHAARHHRENRDRLHQRVHGDTLFLAGSTSVFRQTADRFLDLAFDAPGSAPGEDEQSHHCTELRLTDGTLSNGDGLHVQYRARWSAAS